jgi:AbiV family abortive infection protein
MNVSADVLLKGAWYALAQCGRLLRDAVTLHSAGGYGSSVTLALLAHEELGRYRILVELWQQATNGNTITVERVRTACDDHVTKQRRGCLSMTHRAEGSTQLAKLLRARINTRPGTPQFKKIAQTLKQLDKRKWKRTPADRHAMRLSATYVGINDNGTGWNRPAVIGRQVAENYVTDAVNDYALELDKLDHHPDPALANALAAWPNRPPLPRPIWPEFDLS